MEELFKAAVQAAGGAPYVIIIILIYVNHVQTKAFGVKDKEDNSLATTLTSIANSLVEIVRDHGQLQAKIDENAKTIHDTHDDLVGATTILHGVSVILTELSTRVNRLVDRENRKGQG